MRSFLTGLAQLQSPLGSVLVERKRDMPMECSWWSERGHLVSSACRAAVAGALLALTSCFVQTEIQCTEGVIELCPWSHQPAKAGAGICVQATRTCSAEGKFGGCAGEVGPKEEEDCATMEDDNCDGRVNEGCGCVPGTAIACYQGPAATRNVGTCHGGLAMCGVDGNSYGACDGQMLPAAAEDCATSVDDNCDGEINEGCACVPGVVEECYPGPAGTVGVGMCGAGTRLCGADGSAWESCAGAVTPSIEKCETFEDEDCDGDGYCTGAYRWSRVFGGEGEDSAYGLAIDADGNIIVTGSFSGEFTLGPTTLLSQGGHDLFVAKLSAAGEVLWTKGIGGSAEDVWNRVAVDSGGNIVLAAEIEGNGQGQVLLGGQCPPVSPQGVGTTDILIEKLSPDGDCIFGTLFGDQQAQEVLSVEVDDSDNLYITGRFSGELAFGGVPVLSAGANRLDYVAKLNTVGVCEWARQYGTDGESGTRSITILPSSDLVIAGYFNSSIDFGDGVTTTAGGYDGFVARLSPSGDCLWSKPFGTAAHEQVYQVSPGPDDTLFLVGEFEGAMLLGDTMLTSAGELDFLVAKMDAANADVIWAQNFGDSGNQVASRTAADGAANMVFVGILRSSVAFGTALVTSAGDYNTLIGKMSQNGAPLWARGLLSTSEVIPYDLVVDKLGRIYVVGALSGIADLGSGALVTAKDSDAFVVSLSP